VVHVQKSNYLCKLLDETIYTKHTKYLESWRAS
jgi:hypothetical protein